MNEREQTIGVWRRSMWTGGFWWRTIFTVGLYVVLLWRMNQITLTTRRITQRRGSIFTGNETSISIKDITDVTINQSFLGSLLNYGDVVVQSAGSNAAEISFAGLSSAKNLRDKIFDLQDGKIDET